MLVLLINVSLINIASNPPTFAIVAESQEPEPWVGAQFLIRWDGDLSNPVFTPETPSNWFMYFWHEINFDYCYNEPNDPNWFMEDQEAMFVLFGNNDKWPIAPCTIGYLTFQGTYGGVWMTHDPKACFDDECEAWQCDDDYYYTIVLGFNSQDLTGDLKYDSLHCPNYYDLNNDGKVGLEDVSIFLSSYNTPIGHPNFTPLADFDNNGIIDLNDLNNLLSHYGLTNP